MNKNPQIILLLIFLWIFGCLSRENCDEGINLIPMYGHIPKCNEQLNSDIIFLQECDSKYPSRKIAAQNIIGEAWEYFNKADYDASMKRFNQAWLLDTTNADIYWGFGNLMGTKHEYSKSVAFLKRSILLNPDNSRVYESIATSYGQLFFNSKDINLLNETIDNLKMAIRLDSSNANAYGQLTAAYSYFNQKDSARKYLALTDKLDHKAINPGVRKLLLDQ